MDSGRTFKMEKENAAVVACVVRSGATILAQFCRSMKAVKFGPVRGDDLIPSYVIVIPLYFWRSYTDGELSRARARFPGNHALDRLV